MITAKAHRFATTLVVVALLVGLVASQASAGVSVEIGEVREGALKFVQDRFDLSSSAAMQVMKRYEIMNGSSIIDDFEVPDGAVMDFVTVDGTAAADEPMVTYEGSGIMRDASPQFYAPYVKAALAQEDPATRARLMASIGDAVRRGWFVETLTPEQRRNLEAYTLPGEKAGPKAASVIRILVVLNNFPHWNDRAPSASVRNLLDSDEARNHPFTPPPSAYVVDGNPGGPVSTSAWWPAGLTSPTWSNTGITPAGSGSGTSNHPRIDYVVNGHPGTTVDLKEDWFDFLFNRNPLHHNYSVTNYYYANSHGNISIEGNRSDIVGPLESHHQLDKVALGGTGNSFSVQPGTPIIRDIPDPGGQVLRAITADSTNNNFATLFYGTRRIISAAQYYDPAASAPKWTDLKISSRYSNPYDTRRQITRTANFDSDWLLHVRISGVNGGAWIDVTPNYGWNADWDQGSGQTLFTSAEIMQSVPGNRLLSMCYYTHDHNFQTGTGGQAYQLRHTRNPSRRVDDIGGTVDITAYHEDRPKPMDHNVADHSAPNMGYFEGPDSNGGHKFGNWLGDLAQVMSDSGIVATGYNRRIYLYPSDVAGGNDSGGTVGPWSGAHVFIPNSSVVIPVNAGLGLAAHELGHTFGFPDLYDVDFYANAGTQPQPPLFECSMIGPYSVMAHGGKRVDGWLKTMVGWAVPVAVTQDIINAPVPEIEGTLESPVIYKLPGRPHYIHDGIAPSAWKEYYLVENRNRNGSQYFGDSSARGLYIYHADLRFSQTSEQHPMLIIEQADGLFELESNPDGQWGNTDADPFPGSLGVNNWTQFSNPSSYSHGWKGGTINAKTVDPPTPPPGILQPGTSTDSFSRVASISAEGPTMYANLHVVPREVIVTGVEPVGKPVSAPQGALDVPMLQLHFDNDSADPNLSMGDVELDRIRIDENGSSQVDTDVVRASLFDDTDGNGILDPLVDTRIAVAQFQNQVAYFNNLNYRVPLDETRELFISYDINAKASTGAGLSLGVGISTFDYIQPETPGAVQERVRTARTVASAGLGTYRFPINAGLLTIDEAPDTLTVTPVSRAPVSAASEYINPGDVDIPILSLELSVDMDAVEIDRVVVDEIGTINAVSDITSCKLYHDKDINGAVDPTDVLLQETTFANVAGVEKATLDISQASVQVTDAADQAFLITCSLSAQTALPSTLQLRLEDITYVHLIDPNDVVSTDNFPMQSDEATTPLPNNPPAAPLNLTATALADGSIELAWGMSDDDPNKAGENDVTEYHVFRSADPVALPLMTETNTYAIVQVGATTYIDINAPLGVPMYYMVRAYDGVQEGPDSNIAGPVTALDNLAPVFSAFAPADGDQNVPRDTNIVFVIDDAGSGLDMTTLIFEVDGVDVANAPETTQVGSPARQTVTYDPGTDFQYLDNVAVRIQVADLAGNVAPGAGLFQTYSFTIEGPPVFRIAGTVLNTTGAPEANVRVQAGALWALTDAAGLYDITGLAAGTFDVTPTKNGRSFSPVTRSVTIGPSALGIDFVAQAGYDISGIARMAGGGALLAGVTVSDGLHVDVTTADGAWTLASVPAGDYTITARQVGFAFTPPSIDVSVNATTGNVAGLLFEATVETFDISGTVRTGAGDRLSGIQVDALAGGGAVQTATTNLNGAYTLTGLAPGSYTVRPTAAAWAFNPVQTVVDLATDESNVDFAGSTIFILTVPRGLTMISVPVWPNDPSATATFGGATEVRRWDPQVSPPYLTQASADPGMRVAPGRSFWVNRTAAVARSVVGEVVGNDEDIVMNLNTGWNMGGNPYARELPWAQVQVPSGSPASTYGFVYLRQEGTYALVTTVNGLGARTSVTQERGFWMRASSATQVTIQGPGALPAATTQVAARNAGPNSWLIPIEVSAAGRADTSGLAGVLPQADDAACQAVNPPPISPFVDLYFTAQAGNRLAVDVRTASEGAQVWPFEVATDMSDVTVRVALPDLSEVPASKRVTLIDLDSGKRMYARTMSVYSYSSGEGGARHFALEVADDFGGGLMITSALASGTAAGGASVSYTLSLAAEVSAEVLNIAGRKVATLANGQVAAAGANTLTWSGRSSSGTLCPAGRYLVRIQAAADDGQRVGTLAPLSLGR